VAPETLRSPESARSISCLSPYSTSHPGNPVLSSYYCELSLQAILDNYYRLVCLMKRILQSAQLFAEPSRILG
jgi:hypothetical protein